MREHRRPACAGRPRVRARAPGAIESSNPGVVRLLALQRSAGNRAVVELVRRPDEHLERLRSTVQHLPPRTPPTCQHGGVSVSDFRRAAAAARRFVTHYASAGGRPLHLYREDMAAANAWIDLFADSHPEFQRIRAQMEASQERERTVRFTGSPRAMTVERWADLRATMKGQSRSPKRVRPSLRKRCTGLTSGTSRSTPRRNTTLATGRGSSGEFLTLICRRLLSGDPFPVTSDVVHVRQRDTQEFAEWYGASTLHPLARYQHASAAAPSVVRAEKVGRRASQGPGVRPTPGRLGLFAPPSAGTGQWPSVERAWRARLPVRKQPEGTARARRRRRACCRSRMTAVVPGHSRTVASSAARSGGRPGPRSPPGRGGAPPPRAGSHPSRTRDARLLGGDPMRRTPGPRREPRGVRAISSCS